MLAFKKINKSRKELVKFFVIILCFFLLAWIVYLNWLDKLQINQLTESPKKPVFVRSLHGTETDGQLHIFSDFSSGVTISNANLPNEALKRMFDYYLSALGETNETDVLNQIGREIDNHFSTARALAAKQLLDKYIKYKKSLSKFEEDLLQENPSKNIEIESIRKRFDGIRQQREKHFESKELNDMFGFEEKYERIALSQLEITLNKQLTNEQKVQSLNYLQNQLPEDIKHELDAPNQVWQLQFSVDNLRNQGASDDEIYRLRARTFNPEAASRLAELDQEEKSWQKRVLEYKIERNEIIKHSQSDSQKNEGLLKIQINRFSETERIRLNAYE